MSSDNLLASFKQRITDDKLLQTTFYKVSFQNVPVLSNFNGASNQEIMSDSFDLYCQATDLPGKTLSVLEVKKRGFTLRLPNVVEYSGDWKTTILLNLSLSGYRSLLAWQAVYSDLKKGLGGERGMTTAQAIVTILDNNFNETTTNLNNKLVIYGIFPKEVPTISMKHDASETITVDATFAYSYTNDFGTDDPLASGK